MNERSKTPFFALTNKSVKQASKNLPGLCFFGNLSYQRLSKMSLLIRLENTWVVLNL